MVRFTVRAQSLMKHLVLALAAVCVGMPAYGSDIVVLTDLKEKYIVNKSAVRVTFIDQSMVADGIDLLATRKMEAFGRGCESAARSDSVLRKCMQIAQDRFDSSAEERSAKKNLIHSVKSGVLAKSVRFRPIFVDLNNSKRALGYMSILCMNKKALAGKPSEWLYAVASGIAAYNPDVPDSASELAIEALKVRVCDVYGVF